MGPRANMRVVFNTHNSQASGSGKSGSNFRVQFIGCQQMCRTTPSVKKVLKRLSTVKQSCESSKSRRSVLPSDALKSGFTVKPNAEFTVNTCNGFKFSTTVETLTVSTGSEARKRKRGEIWNSLVDCPIITTVTQASPTTSALGPSIVSKTDGPKKHCKNTSPPVSTQNLDPSISKETQNLTEQKNSSPVAKRSRGVTQTEKMIETRAERTRKLKSISKNVSGKSVGKNVSRKSVGKKVSGKSVAMNMSGKKCTRNLRTPACSKKGGIKSKACSEDSLLQQMIQCCTMLKDSPSDSHRHIAQLLDQEIEKAKEGDKSAPALKKHCEQHSNNTSRNDDFTKPKVDDHRSESLLEERNTESQVLEIEASFHVEPSAAGGNQEIRSISLFPPTVLSPNVNRRRNDITEMNSVGRVLENNNESPPQVPLILTPYRSQQDSQAFATKNHTPAEQHSFTSHNQNCMLTRSPLHVLHNLQRELELTVPQNLQPIVHHTQEELHPSDPHHLQSKPNSSFCHSRLMKYNSSFSKVEETNTHSPVPLNINLKPHISEPQHTLLKSYISDPHHIQAEPYSSNLHHTQSDPHSHDSHHMQTYPHFSVPHSTIQEPYSGSPHHTQKEPHSYFQHHIQKDHHSSDSHHTQMTFYSSVPHHTHTEGHSSVPHNCKTEPRSSVPHSIQQESHNSHKNTQPHSLCMPKEPLMRTEPHNTFTLREPHCSLVQVESHSSQCKTEPHSLHIQTEHTNSSNIACAPSKKKRKEITEKPNVSTCSYNLRSKETSSNKSKSVSTGIAKNTNTLLKTHCKSDLWVCLTRVEHELPNMADNITKAKCLPQQPRSTADATISLPVSIARSVVHLPSQNVKLQERLGDSGKMEDVDDQEKETHVNGSNGNVCIDGDQEWVAGKERREMSVNDVQMKPENVNSQVVAGVQYNQERTGAEFCHVLVSAVNSLRDDEKSSETSAQNYQAVVENSLKETSIKKHQMVADVDSNAREAAVEDCQTVMGAVEDVEVKSAEDFQKMNGIDDNTDNRCIEGCQIMVGAIESMKETDYEDCQMLSVDSRIEEADPEDCQKMISTDSSIEKTDNKDALKMVGAGNNIEETHTGNCRMVGADKSNEETDTEDCQKMVGAGDSIEETDTNDCLKMKGADDIIEGTNIKDCKKMVWAGESIEETDVRDCQKMVGSNGSIEETDAEDCQKMVWANNSIEEIDTETCQMMVDADDNVKEILTENSHIVASADDSSRGTCLEKNLRETSTENYQMMVGADTSIKGRTIEDCLMLVGTKNYVGGTYSEISQGGIGGEICQLVVGAEDTQRSTDVEDCHMTVGADNSLVSKYAESSYGRTNEEIYQVMKGAESTQGRTDVEDCHMMLGADTSLGGTYAESCQVYDDNTISYLVSSLNGVSSSDYFDVHNAGLSLEETDMFLNFEPKEKSVLCELPIRMNPGALVLSNTPPAGENLHAGCAEQSVAIGTDDKNTEEALGSALSGQCEGAALDHIRHPYSKAGEENMVAQHVYQMPDEAQLFENLESHCKGSEDWHLQVNSNASSAMAKKHLVNKELKIEKSAEGKDDPGKKDAGSPAGSDFASCNPVLDSQNPGSTSLDAEIEDWRASTIRESADSDQEDVLSICISDFSLLGGESSSEEDRLSESDDPRAFDEGLEDHTKECHSLDIKNTKTDGNDNDEALREPSGCNISIDELEAGPGSDHPLSPTDSYVESLLSESSVIDRIIEDDARCSLSDVLEDDISTKDEANKGIKGEAHAEVSLDDEKVAIATPLSIHSQIIQCKSLLKVCTETPCLQDSVVSLNKFSCQSKPIHKQVTTSSPKGKSTMENSREWNKLEMKPSGDPFKVHESTKDKGTLLPIRQIMAAPAPQPSRNCESSYEKGMLFPGRQIMVPPAPPPFGIGESAREGEMLTPVKQILASSTPPPPPFGNRKVHMPRPTLPQHLGVCFIFINRGFCNRSPCTYSHKMTEECETYLGLLILHHVTEEREEQAWSLLNAHLTRCGYPLPLAISLLVPLAQYLVKHSHNRQCSNIKVRSPFTLPLDIAKVRVLCETHQGKAAFKLLCACHSSASPEGLQILVNIFVKFCERSFQEQLRSPWEKVAMWHLESNVCDAEAKLKDLLNMEWLRIHMLDGNANKVWDVYKHLTLPMTTPSVFFTRLTCQVIRFFNHQGQVQDSFCVLGEVRRLRANSGPIFTALIPKNKKGVPAVVEGLKELSQLVCELCVPMSSRSWNLLLTYMMDIGDLYQTINLFSVQVRFMTPKISILKRLLEECIKGSPILLKPLCSLVCMLPRNVLVPLQPSLSSMMDAFILAEPSACHIQSLIQHCGKFGINLTSQTQAPVVPQVVSQAEPCQGVSDIPSFEYNSKKSHDVNRNNDDSSIGNNNSIKSSNNSNSSNSNSCSSSNCSCNGSISSASSNTRNSCIMRNLQTSTALGRSVNTQNEGSRHEVHGNGHVESNGDVEPVQDVVKNGAAPTTLEQNEMPLPPSPTSLPPSGSVEPVDYHNQFKQKTKTTALIRPVQPDEQVTTDRQQQHLQQSVVENSSYQQPSIELSCNSDTKHKSFTNMNLRNDTLDLNEVLLTPESTSTSVNPGHEKIKRGQVPAVNSNVLEPEPFSSVHYRGSYIRGQGCPTKLLNTKQEIYSESSSKNFSSLNKTVHNLLEAPVKDRKLEDVEVPQFRVVKKKNNRFPKTTSNKFIGNGSQKVNQRSELSSELNSLLPFDAKTYIGMEDNSGFDEPQSFPQEFEQAFKTSSSVILPLQKEHLSNYLRTGNTRCQQTSRSWKSQQDCEQSHFSAQFSDLSAIPCNTQQDQWFQLGNLEALNHPCQQSHTQASSPSLSSEFSDPYMHSSPASHQSSRVSLMSNEYGHLDVGSSLVGVSVSWLHEIAAMKSQEEKKQKLTEVAAALTDGNNIFSSGTKITAILKAYGSRDSSAEEKEVMGALAVRVMVECSRHKIYSEAELVVLALHQQRLSFNSLAVWDEESYSEQQLAVMALRVLHHMGNHKLFVSILEDTCWFGNGDDVRARLELLSEVLNQQYESGLSQIVLWCTGRVLASLVTYYHQDIYKLHNYHSFIDLPRQLEAAWNWSEACGNVDVMEQFTVTLSTALRLGLPFSQHFLCRLRQKGVIVDNMDTLVAAEDLCRPFQPQRGRRGRACQWRVNINRLPKGIERNKKRNGGTFRGFFRNVRKRGNLIGQIAFREKLV